VTTTPPPIAPSPPPDEGQCEISLDEDGRLAESIACRRCGYDLRGLDPDGRCPECRTAVARSIRGDLLRFSDPEWTSRLAAGMFLLILGIIAQIGWGLVSVSISVPSGAWVGPPAGSIGHGLIAMLQILGVWLLTSPDPGAVETTRPMSARVIARYCFIAQVFAAPLMRDWTTGGALAITGGTLPGWFRFGPGFIVLGCALALIAPAGYAAGFVYLQQLARRIPRPSLARQTRIVMWGFISAEVAGRLVGLISFAFLPAVQAAGGAPEGGLLFALYVVASGGCFAGLASIVFGVWALVLLFLYRGALREAAEQARAGWAAEV
jgi:hypothetical protein